MAVSRIATGTGNQVTGSSASLAASNTCNAATSGANTYAVVGVNQSVSTNSTSTSVSVTYGGVAMTQLGIILTGSSTNRGAASIHYLANPATGSQTVTATSGGTSTKTAIALLPAVYNGVSSLDAAVSDIAGSASISVTSAVGNKCFCVVTSGFDITAINQNQLYDAFTSVGGNGDAINVSDADGAGTVTFTPTGSATSMSYIACDINAVVTTSPGQFFAMF